MEFKKVKVPNLREIAIKMNVSQTGANKRLLFDRIMASGGVTKIDENRFKYSRLIAASAVGGTTKLPTWVDLMPQPIPQIDGVDMATGATVGFFGPTNKENVAGAERHILLGVEIERPIFGPKRKKARVPIGNHQTNRHLTGRPQSCGVPGRNSKRTKPRCSCP